MKYKILRIANVDKFQITHATWLHFVVHTKIQFSENLVVSY